MLKLWLLGIYISAHLHGVYTPYDKDMNASVILHMKWKTPEGMAYGTCSGTYIMPRVILTAAHCTDTNGQIWAKGITDTYGYSVHLLAWDKTRDLALLEAPFKHSYVPIGHVPKRKSYVLNIGNPYDFNFVPSEGLVSIPNYKGRYGRSKANYLITTAMANPGSSGGGAFDKDGKLIGVNTMIVGIFGWTGITMAVNTVSINAFLDWCAFERVIP